MLKQIIITGIFIACSFFPVAGQVGDKYLTLKDTIKDSSIEVPQEIERNLDQLLIDWRNKYIQGTSCNQFSSTEIFYPDSIYIKRLYSLPSEMELVYNQIVRSYIDMYTSRRKSSVEYMLAMGKYYYPFIEEALDKHGLPLELKYLPVIESALNPVAVSRAGATGLWQFMLRTGKMYDLEVNSLIDERRDPRKATEAAVRYLKDLYDIYEDWNLVIAAYNCGPGNVNKAIKRSGGLTDYWAIYSFLPRETRGYVPAFIAANYIMNYYSDHNICPREYIYPVSVDTIMVNDILHFKQISEVLNIPIEEIRDLNPQYKKDIIPGNYKGYSLCLPSNVIGEFIANQESIFTHKSNELLTHRKTVDIDDSFIASTGKATKTHKIRKGESLGSIAKKYGVTVSHLKRMNNMKSNKIVAGKTLVINRKTIKKAPEPLKKQDNEPVLAENPNPVEANATSSDNYFSNYYKQIKEERLEVMTDTIEVSQDILAEEEELERNNREDTRTIYHKIKIGETIAQIANKYNVETEEILAWNNLNSKKVKIGQRLMIILPEKKEEQITESVSGANITETPTYEEPVKTVSKATKQSLAETKKQTIYKVRKGDSLYLIAKKFKNITAEDIMLANNLKSNKLDVGQKLHIPLN